MVVGMMMMMMVVMMMMCTMYLYACVCVCMCGGGLRMEGEEVSRSSAREQCSMGSVLLLTTHWDVCSHGISVLLLLPTVRCWSYVSAGGATRARPAWPSTVHSAGYSSFKLNGGPLSRAAHWAPVQPEEVVDPAPITVSLNNFFASTSF